MGLPGELKGWGQDVLRDVKYAGTINLAISTNLMIFLRIIFDTIFDIILVTAGLGLTF